jgi:tetratricopeptide (TPR) repeat protein
MNLLLQGRHYLDSERWEDALACVEELLIETPQNAEAHALAAQIYTRQGFAEYSRKHLEAAHAFAPDDVGYAFALIDDYLHAGEASSAIIHLQILLTQPEGDFDSAIYVANVMARLGQCFFFLGQWQDALRAFLEVLSQPVRELSTYTALLYALEITFRQQQYDQATLILQSLQIEQMPSAFTILWKTLWARVCYWQGDFVQARYYWQEVLEQRFDEQCFNALHLLPPPVPQSAEDAEKWELLLTETIALFPERPLLTLLEGQSLFNPFDFSLRHTEHEQHRLQFLGDWYLRHFPSGAEEKTLEADASALATDRHVGVITDFLSVSFCAMVLPWLHYYRQHGDYRLTLFYNAGEIPPELLPFNDLLYQLPLHVSQALTLLNDMALTTLIYTQLKGDLYRLAMTPPTGTQQYLYPLHQYHSGLATLSQKLIARLCATGIYLATDCVPAITEVSRRGLGLPTLGHLYFFTVTPASWSPAMDTLAEAILNQDRKAFIIALKIPESTMHIRIQQRHEHSISRSHRIRWVDIDALTLIPLVDSVVGTSVPESEFIVWQALCQGRPVGYFDQGLQTPLSQKLNREAYFGRETNVFSLADILTESVRHVRLESTSFRALSVSEIEAWESILLSLEEPL